MSFITVLSSAEAYLSITLISKNIIFVLMFPKKKLSNQAWIELNKSELLTNDTEAHLDELVQGGVGGIVGNEEPHVFVGNLHRGRSVHTSHCDAT